MTEDFYNLSVRNAMIAWCFKDRVEDVRELERYFSSQELATFGWPNLGGASNRGEPWPLGNMSRDEARHHLDSAWKNLLLDFRQRVARGQIHLRGVQSKPVRGRTVASIPSQWVADFRIDALNGTIEFDEHRYIDVTASLNPPDVANASPATPQATFEDPEQLANLSDEAVLALLEEHHKRVARDPNANMFPPAKLSLMPLIRRRMLARAEQKQTRETLAAEAAELAEWIATKVPSHQVPSASAIENALRNDYRPLKPQSTSKKP